MTEGSLNLASVSFQETIPYYLENFSLSPKLGDKPHLQAEDASMQALIADLRVSHNSLETLRTKYPQKFRQYLVVLPELEPEMKAPRNPYIRKRPKFTSGMDIIPEDQELCTFSCSTESLLRQVHEISEKVSEHLPEETTNHTKPRTSPQLDSTSSSSPPSRSELTDPSVELLPTAKSEGNGRKVLCTKCFTPPVVTQPSPPTTDSTSTRSSTRGYRGRWTDPNTPKEADKLWSLWEPRHEAAAPSDPQPSTGSSDNNSDSTLEVSLPKPSKRSGSKVIISRLRPLQEPLPPKVPGNDDFTFNLTRSPAPAAVPKTSNPANTAASTPTTTQETTAKTTPNSHSAREVPFTSISSSSSSQSNAPKKLLKARTKVEEYKEESNDEGWGVRSRTGGRTRVFFRSLSFFGGGKDRE